MTKVQKTNKEKMRIEKVLKGKVINCVSSGKDMITHLIIGLVKNTLYKY